MKIHIEISDSDDSFGGLSPRMQKALTFMFTRHLVSLHHGDGGELGIGVPHPKHPDYPLAHDYTRALGGKRNIDAMVKAGLVKRRLRGKAATLVLTEKAFGMATDLMSAIAHALEHPDVFVKKAS